MALPETQSADGSPGASDGARRSRTDQRHATSGGGVPLPGKAGVRSRTASGGRNRLARYRATSRWGLDLARSYRGGRPGSGLHGSVRRGSTTTERRFLPSNRRRESSTRRASSSKGVSFATTRRPLSFADGPSRSKNRHTSSSRGSPSSPRRRPRAIRGSTSTEGERSISNCGPSHPHNDDPRSNRHSSHIPSDRDGLEEPRHAVLETVGGLAPTPFELEPAPFELEGVKCALEQTPSVHAGDPSKSYD